MKKRWVYPSIPPLEKVRELSIVLNINIFLSTILIQRGIDSFDKAKEFFRPSIDLLHDPFLLTDMDKAVEVIVEICRSSTTKHWPARKF